MSHKILDYKRYLLDRSIPEPNTGCWLWTNCSGPEGYGKLRINGKYKAAHRLSYEVYIGPITKKKIICHSCDTPGCVNPNHLFMGTDKDNAHDCIKKGRFPFRKRKLSYEDVQNLKEEYASGKITHILLAEKYDISPSIISDILNNKAYLR